MDGVRHGEGLKGREKDGTGKKKGVDVKDKSNVVVREERDVGE